MSYETDLTDEEWEIIEKYFQRDSTLGGRENLYDIRAIVDAIFYILKTGCRWRDLPKDKPPCHGVYYHYKKWKEQGVFDKVNAELLKNVP